MFPLNWNIPFIKKNGVRSTLGKELAASTYTLPTASAGVKGGVKIGNGLTMTGEVLSVTGGSALYLHQMTFQNGSQGSMRIAIQFFTTSSTPITKEQMFTILYNSGTAITLFGINAKTSSSSSPVQSITAQITDTTEEFVFKEASSSSRNSVSSTVFTDEVIEMP